MNLARMYICMHPMLFIKWNPTMSPIHHMSGVFSDELNTADCSASFTPKITITIPVADEYKMIVIPSTHNIAIIEVTEQ